MKHEDNITFTISQVAKMLGVVPATIRNWEKNGLIKAKRTASNYRVFTLDDIETLKKIKEYSGEKRMGVHVGRRANWKKAMVKLTAESKTIEFFEGMV